MDTAPLPAVPSDEPPSRGRDLGAARAVVTAAGVVSGGLVLIGVGLIALQLLKGGIAPGAGRAVAAGPTWGRALLHVTVGLMGEMVVWLRPHVGTAARVWMSAAILVAAAVVLWVCWWQ